jgi:haloalkane dehalogenase
MPIGTYGEKARAAAGLTGIDRIPGKHFPQEDQAPTIATRVASIALAAGRSGAPGRPA